MNIRQKEKFFFFTHAITILSLFTYSVCDEKVKSKNLKNVVKKRFDHFKVGGGQSAVVTPRP